MAPASASAPPLSPARPGGGVVLPAQPELGGGSATPAFGLPEGAPTGLPGDLGETRIGASVFRWGTRTFLMGILNVTPDSFSGDGLLPAALAEDHGTVTAGDPVAVAVALAGEMIEAGADVLDVGGESTRPGHAPISASDEIKRVVPVVEAVRASFPAVPLSIDTTKPAVARAALEAGANLINDVWGVLDDDAVIRVAAENHVPIVLMHNRAEARYTTLMPEILADLQRAIERALRAGVAWESILIDPGFGFGKTAEHNLALLRDLASLRLLGRPIVLGTSRKSTLGKVLDLPAEQRVEATVATTVLGIAAGIDMVRVHDVRPNARAARMTDAVVRGDSR
jgi:dihydropteroate synthase